MRVYLYDVYDSCGKKIMDGMTNREVADALGIAVEKVSKCSRGEVKIPGGYDIEKAGMRKRVSENSVKSVLLTEWDDAIAVFKNVEWVKKHERGVRKLNGKS